MSMVSMEGAQANPAARSLEGGDYEERFRRMRSALLLFYGVLVAFVVATFIYRNGGDRVEARRVAEASAQTLTRALEQHASRLFEAAEQMASDTRGLVEESGGAHMIPREKLHLMAGLQEKRSREIRDIWIVDSYGHRRQASADDAPGLDLSSGATFVFHRDHPQRAVRVSPPVRSPVDGRWIIPVSARLDRPGGAFGGMVVVAIDVEKVVEFYRSLDLESSATITVFGADLTPYISYPHADRITGTRFGLPLREGGVKEAPSGLVDYHSPVLGGERFAVYRQLDRRALYVAISVDSAQIYEAWWNRLRFRAVSLVLVIAAFTLFTVMLLRQLKRERRATERLHELNAHLEGRVSERTAQLLEANEQLESFNYSVSHDLRAPLWHVRTIAEMLKDEHGPQLGPEPQRLLDRLMERSDYMKTLIDSLLALSGLARRPLKQRSLDLSAMALELIAEFRSTQPGRDVETRVQSGLVAQGDEVLIRTMLQNLLGNAWKFSAQADHPLIEVGAAASDAETVFFVRDNGVGFDVGQAQRLFGAFQRLHSQVDFPGTGIGLASARRILQRHGGRIWAESAPGHGATFHFTLPT
jgi:signal transduction histidine kinase